MEELEKRLFSMDFKKEIIIDVETISYNDKEGGLNPFGVHRISVIGIKPIGCDPIAIPIRHRHPHNTRWLYPFAEVLPLLREWAGYVETLVNANPKFDMRFLCAGDAILLYNRNLRIYDTQWLARFVKNDLFSYGLENLCKHFGLTHKKSELIKTALENANTKDYGAAPLDILIEYLFGDLQSTEDLYVFLISKIKETNTKGTLYAVG
jgi:hypothetical protein